MRDRLYDRFARPHHSGGWQLHATAVGEKNYDTGYVPSFTCTHDDGNYHPTPEDALSCPQYGELVTSLA
jgi:hypothetical protein